MLASSFQRTIRFVLSSIQPLFFGRSGLQRYDLFIYWQSKFSIIFDKILYYFGNQLNKIFIFVEKRLKTNEKEGFLIGFRGLGEAKNRVLAGLNELDGAHKDEIGEDGLRSPFINMCDFLELLKRDFLVLGEVVEELLFSLGEGDFRGFRELVGLPHLN